MSWKNLFFEDVVPMKRGDVARILVEGGPGVGLAVAVGASGLVIAEYAKHIDALVASVVLGMVVRTFIARREALLFRLRPGILLAQALFIPVGIILYGKNLELRTLASTHPMVIAQTTMIAVLSMVLMLVLGKIPFLRLKDRTLYLLGFGSAVCGASAMAITSPIVECEPDETAMSLVTNTIAVLVALALFTVFFKASLDPSTYAAMAGELMHQTGIIKMALADAAKDVQKFGLAVKSLRVAMLLIFIPIVSYRLRRRFFLPWYLILFACVGVLFSYATIPEAAVKAVTTVHNACFAAALASIGLTASLGNVLRRVAKPLVLVLCVFGLDLAVFLGTHGWFLG